MVNNFILFYSIPGMWEDNSMKVEKPKKIEQEVIKKKKKRRKAQKNQKGKKEIKTIKTITSKQRMNQ